MEDMVMRTLDFTPLLRHSVGFDRLQRLLDESARTDTAGTYPPYNILQTGENEYRISIALAGFAAAADFDLVPALTEKRRRTLQRLRFGLELHLLRFQLSEIQQIVNQACQAI